MVTRHDPARRGRVPRGAAARMRHDSAVDEHTWHKRTQTPLIIASLAYLVAYSWRVIGDLQGGAWTIATVVVTVTLDHQIAMSNVVMLAFGA